MDLGPLLKNYVILRSIGTPIVRATTFIDKSNVLERYFIRVILL